MILTPPELARIQALGPQAYVRGADIHIAPRAEEHLAHEAAHVVQQRDGGVQAADARGAVNNDAARAAAADVGGFRRP
jgi:hypothetical protein